MSNSTDNFKQKKGGAAMKVGSVKPLRAGNTTAAGATSATTATAKAAQAMQAQNITLSGAALRILLAAILVIGLMPSLQTTRAIAAEPNASTSANTENTTNTENTAASSATSTAANSAESASDEATNAEATGNAAATNTEAADTATAQTPETTATTEVAEPQLLGDPATTPVAKIGSAEYTTLAAAFAAAQNGQTITLLSDVSDVYGITVSGKQVTLDMAGFTITSDYKTNYDSGASHPNNRVMVVQNGGSLTITGEGTIQGPTDSDVCDSLDQRCLLVSEGTGSQLNVLNGTIKTGLSSNNKGFYGIFVKDGGKVALGAEGTDGPTMETGRACIGENHGNPTANIDVFSGTYTCNLDPGTDTSKNDYFEATPIIATASGNINISGGTFTGANGFVTRWADSVQTINITGGTFNVTDNTNGKSIVVGTKIGTKGASEAEKDIEVSGGTFNKSDVSEYLADGVKQDENGNIVSAYAAQIGNTKYDTLEDAIAAASEGVTITMLSDCTIANSTEAFKTCLLPKGSTLDLGGYTITLPSAIQGAAVFEGENITIQNGTFVCDQSYAIWIGNEENTTTATLKNLTSESGVNVFAATATLEDCNINSSSRTYYAIWADENASVTVKSGTYTGGASGAVGTAVEKSTEAGDDHNAEAGYMAIEGGTFTYTDNKLVPSAANANIEVSGGTFSGELDPAWCAEGFNPTANADGTYTVSDEEGAANSDGVVQLANVKFTFKCDYDGTSASGNVHTEAALAEATIKYVSENNYAITLPASATNKVVTVNVAEITESASEISLMADVNGTENPLEGITLSATQADDTDRGTEITDENGSATFDVSNNIHYELGDLGTDVITNASSFEDQKYDFGTGVQTLTEPERTASDGSDSDYKFAGWYTDWTCTTKAGDGSTEDSWAIPSTATTDQVFFAKWELKTYTVNFVTTPSNWVVPSQTVDIHNKIEEPKNVKPTFEGYDFKGWYTQDGSASSDTPGEWGDEFDFAKPVEEVADEDGVVTIYAKFVQQVTVTFNTNFTIGETQYEGTPVPDAQTFDTGLKATAPAEAPTATGYAFDYWYSTDENTEFDFDTEITASTTLTAKWHPITYTFSFKKGTADTGDDTDKTQTFTYDVAQNLTSVESLGFSKTGYHFDGWTTTVEGETVKVYDDAASVLNAFTEDGSALELTASWAANTYTVHFDKGTPTFPEGCTQDVSGSMDNQTLTYGTQTELSANNFALSGYKFTGWKVSGGSDDANDMVLEDKATVPNADAQTAIPDLSLVDGVTVTLTAQWEKDYSQYKITLWQEAKDLVEGEKSYECVDTITADGLTWEESDLTEESFTKTYDGFKLTEIQNAIVVPEGGKYQAEGDAEAKEYPTEVKVIYDRVKYTANFMLNYEDASATPFTTVEKEYGRTFDNPTPDTDETTWPTRDGYTFSGWYKDADCTDPWNFSVDTMPYVEDPDNSPFELYAKWTINPCKVTFDVGAGSPAPTAITVNYGDTVAQPYALPTRVGYDLEGWYTDTQFDEANKFTFDSTQITEDTTLTAHWVAHEYTITYDTTQDTKVAWSDTTDNYGNPSTYTIEEANNITLSAPTHQTTGYSKTGWKDADGNVVTEILAGSTGDITLYAYAEADPVTVKYEAGDGVDATTVSGLPADDSYNYNDALETPAAPTREGYQFVGWDISGTGTFDDLSSLNATGTQDATDGSWTLTLKAKWVELVNINFVDTKGGSPVPDAVALVKSVEGLPITVNPGTDSVKTITAGTIDPDTLSEPSKTGYTFDKWLVGDAESGAELAADTTFTEDTTIYATYTADNVGYTVEHYKMTEDGKVPETATETETKEGYTDDITEAQTKSDFIADGYVALPFDQKTIAGDGSTVVKILYYVPNVCTATFNGNGKAIEIPTQTLTTGSYIQKPADPTASGAVFGGWYKEGTCSEGSEWNFDTDKVDGDTVLFAKWTDVVSRLAGSDAVETGVEVVKQAFPEGADTAVLATNGSFYDSMSAAGMAGALNAPILLTSSNALLDQTKAELEALGVQTVYIVGGTAAISQDVEDALTSAGCTVERVFGEDAVDTSTACANEIVEIKGAASENAIIATSNTFQDALSMSSYAYENAAPIFLETGGETSADRALKADQIELLTTGAYKDARVIVAGGTAAVSDESVACVRDADAYDRYAGDNAYGTSAAIAEALYADATQAVIATGDQAGLGFDALTGSALAGLNHAPILLADGNTGEYTAVDAFVEPNADKLTNVYILGGTAVMPRESISMHVCDLVGQEHIV